MYTSVIGPHALIVAHLKAVEDPGNVVVMLPISKKKNKKNLINRRSLRRFHWILQEICGDEKP